MSTRAFAKIIAFLAAALAPWCVVAQSQSVVGSQLGFVNLYSFTNAYSGLTNGYAPSALLLGGDGNLYGALQSGGVSGEGAIFSMTTNGALLWTLSLTGTNGGRPSALLQGQDGNLYGVGSGTVFSVGTHGAFNWSLAPTNNASVLWLMQGQDGSLYGTCPTGDSNNYGAIVSITTNGAYQWTVSFNHTNGANPETPLIQGMDGNLYGSTTNGGPNAKSAGLTFSMTTNGAFNWEYAFSSTNNGAGPFGQLLQGNDGNLYGLTGRNGLGFGSVFSLTTNGVLSWRYEAVNSYFTPTGTLLQGADGNLYVGAGNFYSLSTNGTVRWSFSGAGGSLLAARSDGSVLGVSDSSYLYSINSFGQSNGVARFINMSPVSLVSDASGNLFGAAAPTINGGGIVFELAGPIVILSPPADVMDLSNAPVHFTVSIAGGPVLGYQWEMNGVKLSDGGVYSGTQSNELTLSSASAANVGSYSVVATNSYGAVTSAAAYLSLTNSFPTLLSNGVLTIPNPTLFNGNLGYPYAICIDGKHQNLYVSTFAGQIVGATTSGILEWSREMGTPGDLLTTLIVGRDENIYAADGQGIYAFSTNGAGLGQINPSPYGGRFAGLAEDSQSRLYWTSTIGSNAVDCGYLKGRAVWSYNFSTNIGLIPNSLVLGRDSNLYGTIQWGETNLDGAVFCLTTNGALLWSYSLSPTNGMNPDALIQGWDGNLYGTCSGNESNVYGGAFSISTNGVLNWSVPFTLTNGWAPYPSLCQATDGNLYGTTRDGGNFGFGSVFQLTTNGVLTPIYMFSGGADGGTPSAGVVQANDGSLYGTATFEGPTGRGVIYQLALGLPPIPVAPVLQNATYSNGSISFSWLTISNSTYQVEYTPDLTATNWINLGTAITASTNRITFSDTPPDQQRFYRVIALP